MFDHVTVLVSDLKKSKAFYEKALAPIGAKLIADLVEYDAAGFGQERPQFWLAPGNCGDGTHICFAANDRAQVSAFYEAAIQAGGTDNGKPGIRAEYSPTYFAAFVLDFDGNNIEVCTRKAD